MAKNVKNKGFYARLVKITNTFVQKPLIFAQNFKNMYLKFVRNIQPCGDVQRGTLYSVHFQPNEMGDYNEQLTIISDAYEIPLSVRQSPITNHQSQMERYPLPLIYQAQVVRINGYLRLTFGDHNRKSALHLIDISA